MKIKTLYATKKKVAVRYEKYTIVNEDPYSTLASGLLTSLANGEKASVSINV